MKKYFLATNDVEHTSIKFNKQSDKTAEKVLKDGMPLLLELYKELGIKSTFFFTGEIAGRYPEIVKMVIPDGHEVASHGFSHADRFAFDQLGYYEQITNLRKSKLILEDIAGTKVVSFRAPALRVNEFTVKALEDSGFEIDSSIASQRADSFFSFGALKKLDRIIAPRMPYYTSKNSLASKGNSSIYEIPISAFLIPYIGTYIRINPFMANLLRVILHKEATITGKPINFLIHPNECILEEGNEVMERRSNNLIKYLFAEKLRTALKLKNLGFNAVKIYRDNLMYFKNLDYTFCTLTQYKNENTK